MEVINPYSVPNKDLESLKLPASSNISLGLVVPIPTLVPLSKIKLLPMLLAPVNLARKLVAPLPCIGLEREPVSQILFQEP